MQANLHEHLVSNANEERRRRYEYAYAELAQFMTIELLMFNCRGGIGLENRHSERVLGTGGACLAPTETEWRTQGSNPWLCVMLGWWNWKTHLT